ncbi:MAG: SUMF1/EgtB/PvdO family nonheme iron enzyme [Verrucomicrobiota bacterium]
MSECFQRNKKGGVLLFWLVIILSVLMPYQANANDVIVSNITNCAPESSQIKIEFDIIWDNSWRHAFNHDAVWVFLKYSVDSGVHWKHATMKTAGTNPAGFTVGAGTNLDIIVPSDLKGAFLQRPAADQSEGRVAAERVCLVWDWVADGLSGAETVKVMVFAVEMVYISQGSFYAGSGGSGANEFLLTQINTANAAVAGGYPGGQSTPSASWPNGYSAFYAMKYEISQRQYRDFLNSITVAQASNRCSAMSVGIFMCDVDSETNPQNRNGIQKQAGGYFCNLDKSDTTNGASVACNWLNWADLAAYADWAALRPMTELEYEKLCRGPLPQVANEYPWGDAYGLSAACGIKNAGYNDETFSDYYANCAATDNTLVQGPMRCGAFASSLTQTTRRQVGASIYGNMELAGNVWERCVTIGDATGRAYTGEHGDGVLTALGDADAANWPGTNAVGAGARGGSWYDSADRLRTSDRQNAFVTDATRTATYGGRCVRTAP